MTNSDDIFTCKVVDGLERSGPLQCRLEGRNEDLSRNDAGSTDGMIMSFSIRLYSIDLPVSLTFILLVCRSIWSASQLSGGVGEKNVFYTQSGRMEAID